MTPAAHRQALEALEDVREFVAMAAEHWGTQEGDYSHARLLQAIALLAASPAETPRICGPDADGEHIIPPGGVCCQCGYYSCEPIAAPAAARDTAPACPHCGDELPCSLHTAPPPADPAPDLVALVREWQKRYDELTTTKHRLREQKLIEAEEALFSYPLPTLSPGAMPPVAVGDEPTS